jgi:chromosome segregation ATPase
MNDDIAKALRLANDSVKALQEAIAQEEARQKSVVPSMQQTEAHLTALKKERDVVVADLQAQIAKVQEARDQAAEVDKAAAAALSAAEAQRQMILEAARRDAAAIVKAAKDDMVKALDAAAKQVVDSHKQLKAVTAERDKAAGELQAMQGRLDGMKQAAREFAGG